MKINELTKVRKSTVEELTKKVSQLKSDAARAYSDRKAGKDKELKKVKNLKHDIAQIMTIISEKMLISAESTKENN